MDIQQGVNIMIRVTVTYKDGVVKTWLFDKEEKLVTVVEIIHKSGAVKKIVM